MTETIETAAESRPTPLHTRWARLAARLDATTPGVSGSLVFVILLLIYLPTTNWHQAQVNDTVSTIYPAHRLAHHGTWVLDEPPEEDRWFMQVDGGYVSNRFPGAILHGVPAYRLLSDPDEVTTQPGALTSAVLAAAAMGVLTLVFRRLTTPTRAIVGALIAGTATSTWGISSASLWTHTPGQLWLAVAMLALASEAYLATGLAYAVNLFTRPHTAIIAAVVGVTRSFQERAVRPALLIGAGSMVGLVAFLVYNATVMAGASAEAMTVTPITGGYGDVPLRTLLGMPLGEYLQNVANMLLNPWRGFLVQSPFLIVLLLTGGRAAWRASPRWVRSSALGGLAYLLLQSRVNGYTGGADQLVYRLPLEAITAAAPFFLSAYVHGVAKDRRHAPVFWASVGASVSVQFLAAVTWGRPWGSPPLVGSGEWQLVADLAGPATLAMLAVTSLAAGAAAAWFHLRSERTSGLDQPTPGVHWEHE